ncbi:histidine phosphatase superfamily [Bisporella sp. PMI_857]|nr:histidine phosphatase superfamily [Bisporella sp. PMI_857]
MWKVWISGGGKSCLICRIPVYSCNVIRAPYLSRHAAIYSNDFDYETFIEPFLEKLASIDWSKVPISSVERTVKSTKPFAYSLADNASTIKVVEVSEDEQKGVNSLTLHKACPEYSSSTGSDQSEEFRKVYATPPALRFNAAAPGCNFTLTDIYTMSPFWGYEPAIRSSFPFCDLKYTNDLQYFYNTGYGNSISGAIGFPWVNATVNTLIATQTMPLDTINHRRAWISSNFLQFLTNIAIEKIKCDSFGFNAGIYFRVLVNDSLQTLDGCRSGLGGTCSEKAIDDLVAERAEAVGGFGAKCKVDYSISTGMFSVYL